MFSSSRACFGRSILVEARSEGIWDEIGGVFRKVEISLVDFGDKSNENVENVSVGLLMFLDKSKNRFCKLDLNLPQ